MDGNPICRCKTCGRPLNGLELAYSMFWDCSDCAKDKTDVLHCERGCKVRADHLDYGTEYDSEQAKRWLKEGEVYEVDKVFVGGCFSDVYLKEFPGQSFNSVHFTRVSEGRDVIEILAGNGFDNAVAALGLTSAMCTYASTKEHRLFPLVYQVWKISKEDYENLCSVSDSDWEESWGWWRYADGSNLGAVSHTCIINGSKLKVWNASRDFYTDIIEYLSEEIGATSESNVCACTVDLATQNGISLSDLFKTYYG